MTKRPPKVHFEDHPEWRGVLEPGCSTGCEFSQVGSLVTPDKSKVTCGHCLRKMSVTASAGRLVNRRRVV